MSNWDFNNTSAIISLAGAFIILMGGFIAASVLSKRQNKRAAILVVLLIFMVFLVLIFVYFKILKPEEVSISGEAFGLITGFIWSLLILTVLSPGANDNKSDLINLLKSNKHIRLLAYGVAIVAFLTLLSSLVFLAIPFFTQGSDNYSLMRIDADLGTVVGLVLGIAAYASFSQKLFYGLVDNIITPSEKDTKI